MRRHGHPDPLGMAMGNPYVYAGNNPLTGSDHPPTAAISLIEGQDVIAENNRIYGVDKLVQTWDDKSNLIDKGNEFRSLLRRPWTLFGAPGVH